MKKMLKVLLFVFAAVSLMSVPVFAESTIEIDVSAEKIKALESVMVTGKITGVSDYKPVRLTVMGPDGSLAYAPQVDIEDNGEFKKLLQPTIPSFKQGVYTITASHEDTKVTAQAQFVVVSQDLPRNQITIPVEEPTTEEQEPVNTSGIILSADAVNGSDEITVVGNARLGGTDVTLIVSSPSGNLVSIAQITPGIYGDFEAEIKTGGPLWKEDGMYTITANQGVSSEYKETIQVEIKDGVVVPEFGVIASLVLAISIISIIILSSKSKLNILPRY